MLRVRNAGWSGLVALVIVSLMGVLGSADAASAAMYGDFSTTGGTVDFNGVEDDSGSFGVPTPTANGLVFDLIQLSASCGAVAGSCPPLSSESVNDRLRFEIAAGIADAPSAILIRQRGRTTLLAPGGQTAVSSISTNVGIDIFDIDGVPVNNISFADSLVFESDGDFDATDAIGGLDGVPFSGELWIDLDQILADNSANGAVTRMEIDLSTFLTAFGDAAQNAEITTDYVEFLLVPEPGAALLIGLGLFALRPSRAQRS
jgi:hypothetical protein